MKGSSNRLVKKRSQTPHARHTVTLKRAVLCSTLEVQHISLMECMESCGAPMSNTGIPRRADRMGPIVVPHGLSLRTITSCRGHSVSGLGGMITTCLPMKCINYIQKDS